MVHTRHIAVSFVGPIFVLKYASPSPPFFPFLPLLSLSLSLSSNIFPNNVIPILEPVEPMSPSQEFLSPLEGWEARPAVEPGRDEPALTLEEERRLRRMISNRESARRSRMRKQRHLEEMRSQVNRLMSENRILSNRIMTVTKYCLLFRQDNDRFRLESAILRSRLEQIRRAVLLRQLHRLNLPAPLPVCGAVGEPNFSLIV
ncbi:hypothetical protein HPP92_007710 [Vanilla planifolia]|uniref:BZIP domain-containing protein n=1 Tax=Vanilla planifolia TaxID=51239 RepID=A0A835RD48_VANPL|nr:hypothetical protein HPP92_007710 [Vanilla planifolia]